MDIYDLVENPTSVKFVRAGEELTFANSTVEHHGQIMRRVGRVQSELDDAGFVYARWNDGTTLTMQVYGNATNVDIDNPDRAERNKTGELIKHALLDYLGKEIILEVSTITTY